MKAKTRPWPLAGLLFFIVFLNGFEAGGYQACLLSVGRDFALGNGALGMLASAQLVATLVAPLIFGPVADRRGKRQVLLPFFGVFIAGCGVIVVSTSAAAFLPGIFLVGVATSILQYVAISALADAYPQSGKRKMGMLTSMYALGAIVSPMICGALVGAGQSWRWLFVLLGLAAAFNLAAIALTDFSPREAAGEESAGGTPAGSPDAGAPGTPAKRWALPGVVLLCLVMFVYVGFENGYAYFLNAFITDDLGGSTAYLALSMFWLAMVPSRLLCGLVSDHKGTVLVVAACAVTAGALVMAGLHSAMAAVAVSFVLGFFSGAIYPMVLGYAIDFSAGRTASVTGLITASTGLGGAVVTAALGFIADAYGIRQGFGLLALWMVLDIAFAAVLLIQQRRKESAL